MPKASVFKTRVGTELMMGRIVKMTTIGIEKIPCAQIRCSLNEFNVYLKKYFARSFEFWALDKNSLGGLGDTVLVRRLDGSQRPTATVSHAIERVVFEYGNVIDPVTGKRVVSGSTMDDVELRKKLVAEIVDKPFEEDALLFEERRALQLRKLGEEREKN